ncbi:MAG: DUF4254 domain-containing protein [Planctomycetota bacterium]|jgi:hypothetical protein
MMKIPSGREISELQSGAIAEWYAGDVGKPEISEGEPFPALVLEQCSRNYQLWNQEDQARRTDVDDSVIASVKRAIDGLNQQRNDLIEKLDEALLGELQSGMDASAPLNSETAGSIVDRMAIMGLKCHHMSREASRQDADEGHRSKCASKLAVLREQRGDLAACFDELLAAAREGTRRFKVYRQYKMYNDPSLNPELYRRKGNSGS